MNALILKLDHQNSVQESRQDLKINKIVSSVSPLNFIKLVQVAENNVNPRSATLNKITKSIYETLDKSPELFWFKSKGILLSTESCELLDRNRIKVSLDNTDYEGIMDGGHNTFAIALFLIDKLFGAKFKTWEECKKFWEQHFDEIVEKFEERAEEFNFSIPIEIIYPDGSDGSVLEFYDYISEICSARNNNVQLKETAKGNQVGYYDYLKDSLSGDFDVIWKTGEPGKINSEDVISLATLPLIYLKEIGKLPADVKSLNKISIYSQKSKCVEFFNDVLSHPDVSDEVKGKFIIKDAAVKSALDLTTDILTFFDRLYLEFPNMYHNAAPGKFGRISSVNNKKKGKVPFDTTAKMSDYLYPFGFFYPLVTGITKLMQFDENTNEVSWRKNPSKFDTNKLDLIQYVELIRMVNYDPQKIGKGAAFYNQAELIFEKV